MRYIGIIGITVLLAIALIFSTDRKAIRPRVIIWGVMLQFIFALAILPASSLSWIGMVIFAFLVLLYISYNDFLLLSRQNHFLPYPMLFFVLGVTVFLFYKLDSIGIAKIIFYSLNALWILSYILKKTRITKYLFGLIMLSAIGIMIHRGVYGKTVFSNLALQVGNFLKMADQGSTFLFGKLANAEYFDQFGFQFAFSVLPIIIYFSAIISILYYLGIIQTLVRILAKFMTWTMGTSGAETLSCSANIFIGQTEAPLLIRPFLDKMTLSELHAVMVGGFATIAGSVFGGYVRMGINPGYLITASFMGAPAALVFAKILIPETSRSQTGGDVAMPDVARPINLLDAIVRGVTDGLKLAVNVGAMLLAFLALIGLVNSVFAFLDRQIDGKLLAGSMNMLTGEYQGLIPGSLKTLFGYIFSPLAFIMGVPWNEAMDVGNLIGTKISMNELVGYSELMKYIQANALSERTVTIATFALCGFANFGSIGIQLGGISALAPERRTDLSRIAFRAMLGGALVSCFSATIAGILI